MTLRAVRISHHSHNRLIGQGGSDRALTRQNVFSRIFQITALQQKAGSQISIFHLMFGMFSDVNRISFCVMFKKNGILDGTIIVDQQFFQSPDAHIFMQQFLHTVQDAEL